MNTEELKYDPSGLIPCIIQDHETKNVLMLGYMNKEAMNKTTSEGRVTFFSRSKQRLWTKGENSGNFLNVVSLQVDCDRDTILITVNPEGPVCHTGSRTCFGAGEDEILHDLEKTISARKEHLQSDSYTSALFQKGINAIAQKVGEEAVELIIEAKDQDNKKFLNEAADLLFHYLVLIQAKGHKLGDVKEVLRERKK
ncbi:MAG: bifunctional phosphoribosyl-AMP cyclohydrolase/phosphoribosyl-ATP diphosphatase HisIE [Cyclobacteriaceae bacterium]